MQTSWLTVEQYAALSTHVEGAFISPLPAFETLLISGVDNKKYLQGQTTCDINQLNDDNYLHGAHCDAKGKMWSQFYLVSQEDTLIAIAYRDELQASTQQWKKFGVFSKVTFEEGHTHYAVLGLGGENVEALIKSLGFNIPTKRQTSRHNNAMLLALAEKHYMLIMPASDAASLLAQDLPFAAPPVWLAQHIQLGFSFLEQPLLGELVPQMLNLQALNAISFTKGCYIGQETIARLKYRGGNKRAAYILKANTSTLPVAGSDIEIQLGDNWRRNGQVVNAVNIHNELWILAVLPNDVTPEDSLRLSSEEQPTLQIIPLPYSLN